MQAVASNWVWVLDVVFGAIISLGYERLQDALHDLRKISNMLALNHIIVSISFLSFVVYDVGTFHVLINKLPYSISPWSGLRFALDLMMSFLLMVIVLQGVGRKPEESVTEIISALTAWHLGAGAWHLAASLEYSHHFPNFSAFLPHICFIAIYWAGLGYLLAIAKFRGTTFAIDSKKSLHILSVLIFAVSVFRYTQIIKMFQ